MNSVLEINYSVTHQNTLIQNVKIFTTTFHPQRTKFHRIYFSNYARSVDFGPSL